MRLLQHKKEAFFFYRYLSLVYDNFVNPLFWTPEMRRKALALASLDRPDLLTIDVGSGTGFTTEGIVQDIDPRNVTCVDQSPHQYAQFSKKAHLKQCRFQQGDAEDIPFPTDHFDRYVSAGSIEYWPEPQRGIAEAYRVVKPGGLALIVGPLRPENRIARALADTWMLFPTKEQYEGWFRDAGFTAIRSEYIAPPWIRDEHYGIAIVGTKPVAGPSRLPLGPKIEHVNERRSGLGQVQYCTRFVAGSAAGFLFVPMALALSLVRQPASRPGAP